MKITNDSTPEELMNEFLAMALPARLRLCAMMVEHADSGIKAVGIAFLKRTMKDIEVAELMTRLGKK